MPQRYRFTDNQTGKTVEFDWDKPTPPSDDDISAQFATRDTLASAQAGSVDRTTPMASSSDLGSDFNNRITGLMDRMASLGKPLKINSKDRTADEQAALYAQGRTAPGPIVTPADGTNIVSKHQKGLAADLGFKGDADWDTLGKEAKDAGLNWGGDWKNNPEGWHVESKPQAEVISDLLRKAKGESAPEGGSKALMEASVLPESSTGLKSAIQKASDAVITPLVDEPTRAKIGGAIGGRSYSQPINHNESIGDTVGGMWDGFKYIFLNPDMESRQAAQRAALGGAVEGVLSQTDPLTIASTALPVLKAVKAPALALKAARATQAGLGAALAGGGILQAADSDKTLGERLGGVGKTALGALSMLGAVPGKAPVKQIDPGSVAMNGVKAAEFEAARGAAKLAKPATTAFDKGGKFQEFVTNRVDAQHQLARFEDQARAAGASIPTDQSAFTKARQALGTGAKYGVISHDIDAVRQEAEAAGLGRVLTHYLDLHGMAHASEKMAGKGAQIWANLKAGKALPGKYNPKGVYAEIQQFMLNAPPDVAQKVEQMGNKIFQMTKDNFDRLYQAGFIEPKVYQDLKKLGDNYIPQWRILQQTSKAYDTYVSSLDPVTQKVFKAIEGSERMTQDPLDAVTLMLERSERLVAQNNVTTALKNMAGGAPVQFIKDTIIPLKNVAKNITAKVPEGFRALHYWEGGKRHSFAVPEAVADAVTLSNMQTAPDMFKGLLGKSMNVYRALATTLNAPFSLANVIRDPQDARRLIPGAQQFVDPLKVVRGDLSNIAGTGKFYGGFAKAVVAGMKDMAAGRSLYDNPDYRAMVNAGAGFSGMQSQIGLAKEYADNPILRNLAEFSNRMEQTTKMYSYKYLKGAGLSDAEAMMATRKGGGSPDFAVKGNKGPATNMLMMFFNAKMQGIARDLDFVLKNPTAAPGLTIRKLSGPVAMLTLFDHWNKSFKDEDGIRTIDKVNDDVLRNNYVAVLPFTVTGPTGQQEHQIFKLPMGHTGQFLNAIARLATEGVGVTNDTTVPQAAADVVSNVQPFAQSLSGKSVPDFLKSAVSGTAGSLNPLLKIPAELLSGYDTFRGIPVVPRRFAERPAPEQKDAGTSPTAVALADIANRNQKLLPVSPMLLEHTMESVPGLGELGLNLADSIIGGGKGGANPDLMSTEEKWRRSPFYGQLIRRFWGAGGSQVKNDQYDSFFGKKNASDAANRAKKDVASLQGPDAYARFMQDNGKSIALNPALTKIANSLSDLRNKKDLVRSHAGEIPDAKSTLQMLEQAERTLLQEFVVALGDEDPRTKPTTKLAERSAQARAFMGKLGVK